MKPIPGFPGYFATDAGEIISTRTSPARTLATSLHKSGYYQVNVRSGLGRSTRCKAPVHRLVLLAYAGLPGDGEESRHLNGNPTDNRPSNLSWGTHSRNMLDKRDHGTAGINRPRGEQACNVKLTQAAVLEIERRARSGETQSSIAQAFGVTQRHVSDIKRHRTWSHLWIRGAPQIATA